MKDAMAQKHFGKAGSQGSLFKLELQLCFALYSASRMMTGAYRPVLGRFNLTYPQYLVMLVLWEGDGITVRRLGEQLYLDSATLSPLLQRLEKLGFAKRERMPEDQRELRITLTAEGRRLKPKVFKAIQKLACDIGLPDEERLALLGELTKLVASINDFNNRESA